MKKRLIQSLLLAAAALPLLQPTGCTLFDGGLAERTITGAFFDPVAAQTFGYFFDVGAGR